MKNKKFLSVLLCLALLASLPVLPGGAAAADDAPGSGMEISKTATANNDGTYTITLEAYATGSQVTTTVQKDIPTDIILVIDQSGSMADDIGQVSFEQYKDEEYWGDTTYHTRNQDYYEYRHNGGSANLWHKLGDGSYVSVSVTKTQRYTALDNLVNYSYKGYYEVTEDCYWYYANNLYEKVGEEYKRVTIKVERGGLFEEDTFIYTFSDGKTVQSKGFNGKPNFGERAPLYTLAADGNDTVYTYTYTDSTGAVQTIGTSTGANMRFTPAFYQRSTTTSGGGTRLAAIKSAAETFVNSVTAKAKGADGQFGTDDDVNHRIAVVGYADTDWNYDYNTGVFIGSTLNRYESDAARVYGTALQDMSTTDGKNNVTASINALQARGATRTDYGLIMAKGILDANPVPAGETRNRVVIVFTDGSPTNSNGFQKAVANRAISTANAIKAGRTTVYSIGIFSGADASTAGKEPVEDYYEDYWGPNYTDAEMSAACNWFMQKVSSNNGTPRTPSYYLSAGDSASLNSIFQQISDQIESGGSSSTLTDNAVVKDVISQYFTLPEGADENSIKLETYACTGKNGDEYTWRKNDTAMGARATISEDGQEVSVTGFNFSDNYVGTVTENGAITGYRGHKLVISFVVKPKEKFLGGNGVPTNESAGIYENADAKEPVVSAEVNPVDVQIKEVVITPLDTNVYLGAQYGAIVSGSEIKNNMTLTIGGVPVDLKKPKENYGLADWQNKYVEINVEVKDENGNPVTNFEMLEDKKYSVTVTVTPKFNDAAGNKTPVSGNSQGTIHVFTPELTFQDSEVSYMASIADYDYGTNYVETKWRHQDEGDTTPKYSTDEDVTMLGNAQPPELTYEYTPDAARLIADKKVKATDYVPVAVKVELGETDVTNKTTFVHQCDVKPEDTCEWAQVGSVNGNPAFLLHVKDVYADLTITKSGANETADPGQSFLFKVTGPDNYSTEVIIVGNKSVTLKNLKIGTYTVTENTSWSWRYKPENVSESITLKANEKNEVKINNTRDEDQWLDGNVSTDNKFTGTAATTD